jgi:EmrB/QacA subfamily drug resistance transporter
VEAPADLVVALSARSRLRVPSVSSALGPQRDQVKASGAGLKRADDYLWRLGWRSCRALLRQRAAAASAWAAKLVVSLTTREVVPMNAVSEASSPRSFLGTRRGKLTLALVCAVAFIDILDGSIVNIALPQIQTHLHFSVQTLQWVASAYLLTYGGFLLLGGRAADLLGRRRLLVAGTSLFGISSLVCGLAESEAVLIGARLAQGVGAAMMSPAALSILTTSFHTRGDRVKALGAWGGVGAMSGAAGAVFGGVLTTELSWRWVFFVSIPVVAVILLLSFRLVDGDRPKAPPLREFDSVGAGLITAGMLLLVYALVNAPTVGWGTARTLGELAGAAVLIVLFLLNEQRHPNPLVPLSLFKINGLGQADVTQILAMAGFYTMFFLVTLYMQEVLHYSAIRTGLSYLPLTVGLGIGASVTTNAIPKIGTRPLIAAGALLGAGGVFWLSRLPVHGTYLADLLPGLAIMAAGMGCVLVGVQNAANGGVPADKSGLAASLITASFQLGSALGLAIFVSLSTSRTHDLLATHTQPPEALTAGFQRGLLGSGIALVVAAVIALRATNVRVVDMAPGAEDDQALPVPVAG